jgi:hypothetical protein
VWLLPAEEEANGMKERRKKKGHIREFSDIVQTMAVVRLLVIVQTDEEQRATAIYTKNSYITSTGTTSKK